MRHLRKYLMRSPCAGAGKKKEHTGENTLDSAADACNALEKLPMKWNTLQDVLENRWLIG